MQTFARPGRIFCVWAAICLAAPCGRAIPQSESDSAAHAAQAAYQEAANKDFTKAIHDFRVALKIDPTNLQWRKDLAFSCLASGALEDAAGELERVFAASPEDFAVALQLGYVFEQLSRQRDARRYFEIAARSPDSGIAGHANQELEQIRRADLLAKKQTAYDLLSEKQTNRAIETFESVHAEDPSDAMTTLQLGYLYAAEGKMGEAKEMFTTASLDADPKIAAQARAGLGDVGREAKHWFASMYAAPFYQSRFSNEINPLNARLGLVPSRYFEPYVGARISRDIRSQAGTLPQIYSDNSAVFSVGVQSVLARTGAVLYAEGGTALNLLGGRPRAASDYRSGMYWSRAWGTAPGTSSDEGHGVAWTGTAYADAAFYSRYDDDAIGSVQIREGLRLPTGRDLPLALLAGVNLVKDSNGTFYNNVAEVGPVLRIGPLPQAPGLAFETQFLRGFYTAHDSANPYGPRYHDVRVFLIWSCNF